ncbi:MAG: hypothetical protein ACR2OW_09925, partial [Methyloligellaceae bacterium]
ETIKASLVLFLLPKYLHFSTISSVDEQPRFSVAYPGALNCLVKPELIILCEWDFCTSSLITGVRTL